MEKRMHLKLRIERNFLIMDLKIYKTFYNTYYKYTPKSVTYLIDNIECFLFQVEQTRYPRPTFLSYNPID